VSGYPPPPVGGDLDGAILNKHLFHTYHPSLTAQDIV
jgi:hypothetical protein